eukprot:10505433-Alexandrium_andersonii.AAC.1
MVSPPARALKAGFGGMSLLKKVGVLYFTNAVDSHIPPIAGQDEEGQRFSSGGSRSSPRSRTARSCMWSSRATRPSSTCASSWAWPSSSTSRSTEAGTRRPCG